jgi:hypothetical protein
MNRRHLFAMLGGTTVAGHSMAAGRPHIGFVSGDDSKGWVQLHILKAASEGEIDAAFVDLMRLPGGALLVSPDPSSTVGWSSSWAWRHTTLFRRSTGFATLLQPVA